MVLAVFSNLMRLLYVPTESLSPNCSRRGANYIGGTLGAQGVAVLFDALARLEELR